MDAPGGGERELYRHLVNMHNTETKEPVVVPRFPVMLDNWARLGLVEVRYDGWLTKADAYGWVESRPEYLDFKNRKYSEEGTVKFNKGYFRLTNLGEEFAEAVDLQGGT
jgi:hypothetical protein